MKLLNVNKKQIIRKEKKKKVKESKQPSKLSPVHSCLQPAECPLLSAVYLLPPPAAFSPVKLDIEE